MKYISEKKCPQCGESMTHGFFYCGGRPILWVKSEPDYMEDRWKGDLSESFGINGLTMTMDGAAEKSPVAYHCPQCKKIIVDY